LVRRNIGAFNSGDWDESLEYMDEGIEWRARSSYLSKTGRHPILTVRRRPQLAHFDRVLEDLDSQPLPF
jgi:hypothetical protein